MHTALRWRETIKTHYNDNVEEFQDAQSIRIMLYNTELSLKEDADQVEALKEHPEIQKEWIEGSKEEMDQLRALQTELETWLTNRGLSR